MEQLPPDTYQLPAEWESQEAVWLTWPQNRDTWGNLLSQIEEFYVSLCNIILNYQDLYLIVRNDQMLKTVRDRTGNNHPFKLHLVEKKTNDCWIRDYGGTAVNKDGQRCMLNWKFNSWGEKYYPWHDDDRVPAVMAEMHNAKRIDPGIVLEGGAIDVNGKGVLITSATCLLHENRNPGISRKKWEEILHWYLGAEETVWLQSDIAGDDTDGHVDNVARFVNDRTIFCAVEGNNSDCNYSVTRKNLQQLEAYAGKKGMEIVEIPFPPPIQINSTRTPASYVNFLILNGAVLVPTYSAETDEPVLSRFADYFADRAIIPVDCKTKSFYNCLAYDSCNKRASPYVS
jgi:agmatine deiminase